MGLGNTLRLLIIAVAGMWLILLAAQPARAASGPPVKVDVREKVIFCDAKLQADTGRLAQVLRDGTEVGIDWVITIEKVRRFWLNTEVATVRIRRRVITDLVSQSWQLLDMSTGITRRVTDISAVMRFLTHLDHFPVLDRSLLETGQSYVMHVETEEQQGQEDRNWFATWWGYETSEAEAGFNLP